MEHPDKTPPESALALPLCVCSYSSHLKKWMVTEYQDLKTCFDHFNEEKAIRPSIILNFGMIVADNETPPSGKAA